MQANRFILILVALGLLSHFLIHAYASRLAAAGGLLRGGQRVVNGGSDFGLMPSAGAGAAAGVRGPPPRSARRQNGDRLSRSENHGTSVSVRQPPSARQPRAVSSTALCFP